MKQLISLFVILFLSLNLNARNLLKYDNVIDLTKKKGRTYFSLMQTEIKPALDQVAQEGFKVVSSSRVIAGLRNVDSKVSAKAIRAAGGEENLKALANALFEKYETITFYDLPQAIADEGYSRGRYDLSTFIALVSGGGVAVKINSENIAYNVNYGTGEFEKDEMTGRSFGEAPSRLALDASDLHYLKILENYVRSEGAQVENFYRVLLQILLNSDSSSYQKISDTGQAVATDFLAVYTAEQDRHLMAELQTHHWDEALLEVTLLSAFHAGQRNLMVMYQGELTDITLKQASGCSTDERAQQKASMVDYWQFSSSQDPANCNRSGINVTRRDFRKLGTMITAYERENHPELVENIERHFGLAKESTNLFADLSKFLINYETPEKLDKETLELSEDFTAFLMQVRKDANKASNYIVESQQK